MGATQTRPLLVLWVLLVGCKPAPEARPVTSPVAHKIMVSGVPHVAQEPGLGGEACLEMVLRRAGWALTQQDLFRLAGVDTDATGCYVDKLSKILKDIDFPHKLERVAVTGPGKARALWNRLAVDLRLGRPSLVCVRRRDETNDLDLERFRLVVGQRIDQVVFHDPGRADGASRVMALDDFLRQWPVGPGPIRTLVRISFPGDAAAAPRAGAVTPTARLVRRMNALRKELPASVTLVAEPPFVVAGDEAPRVVRERARTTVRWATRRLGEAYGFSDPARVILVWLSKDRAAYHARSRILFGAPPISPYGFFSRRLGVILLNASLGSGTVVHELVHAFTAASFPNIPTWFDEGLGSLYEACGERQGRIHGYINWRLPGLKQAIRQKRLPPFEKLMAMPHTTFSESAASGRNYAQARFLCYYLQQEGKLGAYYKRFLANRESDPTGYRSLQRTLWIRDMTRFQGKWERWVLKLKDGGGHDPDLGKKK